MVVSFMPAWCSSPSPSPQFRLKPAHCCRRQLGQSVGVEDPLEVVEGAGGSLCVFSGQAWPASPSSYRLRNSAHVNLLGA